MEVFSLWVSLRGVSMTDDPKTVVLQVAGIKVAAGEWLDARQR